MLDLRRRRFDMAPNRKRDPALYSDVDGSGSMDGRPLEQAKEAVASALDRLEPTDTFQIIRFSDRASRFGRAPVPATGENVAAARKYLLHVVRRRGLVPPNRRSHGVTVHQAVPVPEGVRYDTTVQKRREDPKSGD